MSSAVSAAIRALRPQWNATSLRIADPKASLAFYTTHFNMTLVARHAVRSTRTEYYLTTYTAADLALHAEKTAEQRDPESPRALELVKSARPGAFFLKLVHEAGSEQDGVVRPYKDFVGRPQIVESGNETGVRGFGHIAFNVDDVYEASASLEAAGVRFKKRPDEGNMKGLAFCLDPDGYFVELVRRDAGHYTAATEKYNLSQTMLRVNDAERTLQFFEGLFGMTRAHEVHFEQWGFSLFFLVSETDMLGFKNTKVQWDPALELTHNHAPKDGSPGETYITSDPVGFVSTGFIVDDLDKYAQALVESNIPYQRSSDRLTLISPTGYAVEVTARA